MARAKREFVVGSRTYGGLIGSGFGCITAMTIDQAKKVARCSTVRIYQLVDVTDLAEAKRERQIKHHA